MKPKKKVARVIKVRDRQIGKSSKKRDLSRKALKPGKRRSRNGKIYYENRRNRSDKKGQGQKTFNSNGKKKVDK